MFESVVCHPGQLSFGHSLRSVHLTLFPTSILTEEDEELCPPRPWKGPWSALAQAENQVLLLRCQ